MGMWKFIYKFDFLGIRRNIIEEGNIPYKSKLSLCLSILLIGILLHKTISLIIKLYNGDLYTLSTNIKYNSTEEVNFTNFEAMVCNRNRDDKYELLNSLKLTIEISNSTNFNYIKHINCTSNNTILKYFHKNKSEEYKNCYCFNLNNHIYLVKDPISESYKYAKIIFKKKEDIREDFNIQFFYLNYYFDYKQDDVFVPNIRSDNILINSGEYGFRLYNTYKMDYILHTVNELDGNIDKSIYQFSEVRTEKFFNSLNNYDNITYEILIEAYGKTIENEVTSFSVDYILAVTGGFYELLKIIFHNITTYYNNNLSKKKEKSNFFNEYQTWKNNKLNLERKFKNIEEVSERSIVSKREDYNILSKPRNTHIENNEVINLDSKNNISKLESFNNEKIKNYQSEMYLFTYLKLDMRRKLTNIYSFMKLFADLEIFKKILLIDQKSIDMFDLTSSFYSCNMLIDKNIETNKYSDKLYENLKKLLLK